MPLWSHEEDIKQTNKKFCACSRSNCFFSFNNQYYIDLKKKPTLMENQFLLGKPGLSNTGRKQCSEIHICGCFHNLFLIHFTQIKEQTKARELAEDM